MAKLQSPVDRSVRAISWVALGVSVCISAAIWFDMFGLTNEEVRSALGVFAYRLDSLIPDLFWAVMVAIVLDAVAGIFGGRNRRIGVISGLILISPLVCFAVIIAVGLIWPTS